MSGCYLVVVPYRVVDAGLEEVDCWLDDWSVAALGCSCGALLRLVSAEDLGVADLRDFYGEPSDEALDAGLQAEYDVEHLVDTLDPLVLALQAPTEDVVTEARVLVPA